MVSLDDAVVARLEYGGRRYEILVDPELVERWKENPDTVEFDQMLATDEVWSDARNGDRPTSDQLMSTFGTTELAPCVERILKDGSIQLTTMQRRRMIDEKRKKIVHLIASEAIDPRSKAPHPPQRIESALEEARVSIDPFLSVERQVKDAVSAIRPLIPLRFATARLAFRIPGKSYGSVMQLIRDHMVKEEWLSNGDWACVVEVPAGSRMDFISNVAKRAPDLEVKVLDEGS